MSFQRALSPRFFGFWNRRDFAEKKNVARNPDRQVNSGYEKGPLKILRRGNHKASNNRRRDSGKLVAQIHDPADGSNALARRNQRRNRPAHWRSNRKPRQRKRNPRHRALRRVRVRHAKNAQPDGGSAN